LGTGIGAGIAGEPTGTPTVGSTVGLTLVVAPIPDGSGPGIPLGIDGGFTCVIRHTPFKRDKLVVVFPNHRALAQ